MMPERIVEKVSETLNSCQEDVREIRSDAEDLHQRLTSIESLLIRNERNAMLYIPEHFKLYELVPQDLYETISHEILWSQLDSRELWTIDALRRKYGKCIINDWYWGGERQESGLRLPNTTTGATWSQHKRGAATDKVFIDTDIKQIIRDLQDYPNDPAFKYITTVEQTHNGKIPTWLHTDCRNRKPNGGIVFLLL